MRVSYLGLSYAASGFCCDAGFFRSVLAKPGARFAEMLGTSQMLWDQRPSRAPANNLEIFEVEFFG